MPDIGSTLREARMRARIDISEIEAETKIRAKYLRALENEEWNLLPGPTFVKSFLRTYAEALGLDAKLLLEEYKLRHERPSEHDLQPIVPRGTTTSTRRPAPRPGIPRGYVVAGLIVALLAVLYLLGQGSDDDDPDPVATPGATATTTITTPSRERSDAGRPTDSEEARRRRRRASRQSRIVRLQVVPKGEVFVCLEAVGQGRLINGVNLQPGSGQPTYRSSRFEITLGNGNAELRLDGRRRTVPQVRNGIGYVITKRDGKINRSVLPPGRRPACGG